MHRDTSHFHSLHPVQKRRKQKKNQNTNFTLGNPSADPKPSGTRDQNSKPREKRTTRGGRGAAGRDDDLTGPLLSLVAGRRGRPGPPRHPQPGRARRAPAGTQRIPAVSRAAAAAPSRSAAQLPARPYLEHFTESPIAQLSYDLPELLRVQVPLDVLVLLLLLLAAQLEDLPKVKERHLSSRRGAGLQAAVGGSRRGPSARLSRPGRSQPGPPGAAGAALTVAPGDKPSRAEAPGEGRAQHLLSGNGRDPGAHRVGNKCRAGHPAPSVRRGAERPPPPRGARRMGRGLPAAGPARSGAKGPRCPGVTARKKTALGSPRCPSRPDCPSPPSRGAGPGRRRFLRGGAVPVPAPPPSPADGACAPHPPPRFPRSRNRLSPPAPPRLLRRMHKRHSATPPQRLRAGNGGARRWVCPPPCDEAAAERANSSAPRRPAGKLVSDPKMEEGSALTSHRVPQGAGGSARGGSSPSFLSCISVGSPALAAGERARASCSLKSP